MKNTRDIVSILSPGSYYLPAGKKITFVIYWKLNSEIVMTNVIEPIEKTKITEDIYRLEVVPYEGPIYVGAQGHLKMFEFQGIKSEGFNEDLLKIIYI